MGYVNHARRLGVPIAALVEAIGLCFMEMERGEVKQTGPAATRVRELAREIAWSRRMRRTD